jgi:protein-tyrosine phosphatase
MAETVSILFVCMGNICRSPMAHGVFRRLVAEAGLADRVIVDSAGTIDYHAGDPPDRRAIAAAGARGVDIGDLRARGFRPADCGHFDLILTMDRGNLNRVRKLCASGGDVRLFLEFAPERREREVPDPYSGGPEAFEYVLDLVEAAAQGLLQEVRTRLEGTAA